MTPRVQHPWPAGRYPYEVFEGTGVTPRTPLGALLDRALELEAEGKMTPELRVAYDAIRPAADRLATDFFLFNPDLCDPAALAQDALRILTRQSDL